MRFARPYGGSPMKESIGSGPSKAIHGALRYPRNQSFVIGSGHHRTRGKKDVSLAQVPSRTLPSRTATSVAAGNRSLKRLDSEEAIGWHNLALSTINILKSHGGL